MGEAGEIVDAFHPAVRISEAVAMAEIEVLNRPQTPVEVDQWKSAATRQSRDSGYRRQSAGTPAECSGDMAPVDAAGEA